MILHTHNLMKTYRQRKVVNDVSVEVKQGEIVGLLGPNGAGKTTTFYMTVGLVQPDEGTVLLVKIWVMCLVVANVVELKLHVLWL
jgi:lipopolysaccharide export system ATP-binding protein